MDSIDIIRSEPSLIYTILEPFSNIVAIPFEYLRDTLSEKSYENIIKIVEPVVTVTMLLLAVYIVFSLLHFLWTLITRFRFKLRVLLSIIISLVIFLFLFATFKYLNGSYIFY